MAVKINIQLFEHARICKKGLAPLLKNYKFIDYFGAKYATHFGVNYASDSGAKYATFLE